MRGTRRRGRCQVSNGPWGGDGRPDPTGMMVSRTHLNSHFVLHGIIEWGSLGEGCQSPYLIT